MTNYNPMFKPGYDILRPYRTRIRCFSKNQYQILCINNSSAPYSESQPMWQGNLHAATILTPDESKGRVVNSMMIASVPPGTADTINNDELNEFLTTPVVRRRVYHKASLK